MNLALAILDLHAPAAFRKKVLRRLVAATAGAFDVAPPSTRGLSASGLLRTYALFTRAEAERLWEEKRDQRAVERRLFDNAAEIGAGLRRTFRLCSAGDVIRMSRVVYRALGISFEGHPDGSIKISACAFSPFYSGRVCRLMSALDAGAAAGLSGGGRLEFSQRITEGHDCCLAHLTFGA
jgi:hypothetical protein